MDNSTTSLKNRYPGIKPFNTAECELFFGRRKDTEEFYRLLMIQQLTVLYGRSGFGKSSLINAGVIPQLTNQSVPYFQVRFGNYISNDRTSSPIQTIKSILRNAPDGNPVPTDVLDTLIPNENSLWYYIKSQQYATGQHLFVIFIDQFEELFSYPAEQIQAFKDELADLLYSAIPLVFRQREEEILNADESKIETFYTRPDIKVVVSIRSDRLSLLNALKDKHPGILRHCYELDALEEESARQAIIQPARMTGPYRIDPFEYEPDALEAILSAIRNKQDGKIETASLQIVCRFVEDNLLGEGEDSLIQRHELGDISSIFQNYYESVLNNLADDEQKKAQALLEDVLIQQGKRIPFEEGYLTKQYGIRQKLLDELAATSLLRKERDSQGRMMYEIGHDTLVGPIEQVAQVRREKEEEEKRLRLEEQLRLEAQEARRLEKIAKVESKKAYKQAEEFKRLQQKAERYTRFALFLAVLAIGLLIFGALKYVEAEKNRVRSDAMAKEAGLAREEALRAQEKAVLSLQTANREKANTLLLRGDGFYNGIKDYQMALTYYQTANSLDHGDPALKHTLQQKIEETKRLITKR